MFESKHTFFSTAFLTVILRVGGDAVHYFSVFKYFKMWGKPLWSGLCRVYDIALLVGAEDGGFLYLSTLSILNPMWSVHILCFCVALVFFLCYFWLILFCIIDLILCDNLMRYVWFWHLRSLICYRMVEIYHAVTFNLILTWREKSWQKLKSKTPILVNLLWKFLLFRVLNLHHQRYVLCFSVNPPTDGYVLYCNFE